MIRQVMIGVIAPYLLILADAAVAKAELASHRAVYDLDFETISPGSRLNSIAGLAAVEIQRHCDGWQSVEEYAISYGFGGGGLIDSTSFIIHQETWEDLDGTAFSFSTYEHSTSEGYQHFSGFAERDGAAANATFITDGEASQALPESTVFPIAYLRQLLASGDAGGRAVGDATAGGSAALQQASVFFGGDRETALYIVSAFVGAPIMAEDPAFPELDDGYFPVRLAYFDPNAPTSMPSHEVSIHIQENGVIRDYLVDYGDVSLKATLTEYEALAEPECS